MEVRTAQDGILRAFALLLGAQSKPRQIKPKYQYRAADNAVHAVRMLSKKESDAVDSICDQLRALNPRDETNNDKIKDLLKQLSAQPVKFVPTKIAVKIDYSKKYPYRSAKRGG
jgi:hypothetical protein